MSKPTLTARDREIITCAWSCFTSTPEVDHDKLAQLAGLKNKSSASSTFFATRKRLLDTNKGSANPMALSDRDRDILSYAYQCFKTQPTIDFEALATRAGLKNKASASVTYGNVKKKLLGDAATSPAKGSRKRKNEDGSSDPLASSPVEGGKRKRRAGVGKKARAEYGDFSATNDDARASKDDFYGLNDDSRTRKPNLSTKKEDAREHGETGVDYEMKTKTIADDTAKINKTLQGKGPTTEPGVSKDEGVTDEQTRTDEVLDHDDEGWANKFFEGAMECLDQTHDDITSA